jgi:CRP-like cAMP-binding protein
MNRRSCHDRRGPARRLHSHIPLFNHVSEAHLRALLRAASVHHVRSRSMLFKEGSRPSTLYLLLKGAVELFSERRDRRRTIAIILSGQPCALASIWQRHHELSARTLAPSQLLLIPARHLHHLMESEGGCRGRTRRRVPRQRRAIKKRSLPYLR